MHIVKIIHDIQKTNMEKCPDCNKNYYNADKKNMCKECERKQVEFYETNQPIYE